MALEETLWSELDDYQRDILCCVATTCTRRDAFRLAALGLVCIPDDRGEDPVIVRRTAFGAHIYRCAP